MNSKALLALLCLLSSPALAQTDTNSLLPEDFREERAEDSVAQRLTEEFRPIGGRLGAFLFFPQFNAQLRSTDNILATDTDQRKDVMLDTSAGFRMVRAGSADRVVLSTQIGQTLHARNSLEDSTRMSTRLYYRLGPEDGSNLQLAGIASRQFISRRDINNVIEARSPVQLNVFGLQSGYQWSLGRTTVSLDASIFDYDYSDARNRGGLLLDQDFRDNMRLIAGGAARYDFDPRFAALVRGSYSRIEYSLDPGDPGFVMPFDVDRDSGTWRLEGGVAFLTDSDLSGTATIGYSERIFSARFGRIPENSGGLSFAADLAWNASPSTTIRLDADRTFLESANPGIFGFRATGGSVGLEHSPATALMLKARANFRDVEALGGLGDRKDYGGLAEVSYFLSRRYRLSGLFGYIARDAEITKDAFNEIYAQFGLTASF